ncbi:O-antigen ligase family protein [Maribacter sp. 1_2014MBL_MicDiv]|uniref:O-antigen ligase family protein n=1 Tax=Maribacter sp. 1_2014MBL_MicDiv TaxID=1644130 RepID=UPI0008F53241|nr:hypothetical protein [Maribacter sp. 1_2014MBL_MicDiv]APA64330.1 hypothetical protein YQ22_08375 [Maribacter sp. 1_2014MBL_MicDiv]
MRALISILFSITLIELFIGGGGRVFEFGSITLRIGLFVINILLTTLLYIRRGRIEGYVLVISSVFIIVSIFYGVLGFLNGALLPLIIEDIKPLSYFLCIIFISYYIREYKDVALVVSLIKKTSFFLAAFYLLIQVLFFFGKLNFTWFYNFVNLKISSSDFMFRGTEGLFFYKGFMYMVLGLIFWIHSPKSFGKSLAVLILTAAMILTGTRGLILMFGILYGLFYGVPLLLRLNVKMLVLAFLLVFGSIYFFAKNDIGDKKLSDSTRVEQIVQVFDEINLTSFFIGHGFGNGVPIRPVHMEIGYLEVFHKQGLVGLCIWGTLFAYLFIQFKKENNTKQFRKPFLLGFLFVILLSSTNPYFNNPLGISMFMIGLASLKVLNRSNTEPITQF